MQLRVIYFENNFIVAIVQFDNIIRKILIHWNVKIPCNVGMCNKDIM